MAYLKQLGLDKNRARWKLGRLLKGVERGHGPGRGKKVSHAETSFRAYLKELGLDKTRASEAEGLRKCIINYRPRITLRARRASAASIQHHASS